MTISEAAKWWNWATVMVFVWMGFALVALINAREAMFLAALVIAQVWSAASLVMRSLTITREQ